jgi:hypothetical protein
MLYKAEVPICSEIHTEYINAMEHHVKFLNGEPGGAYSNS